MPNIFFKDRTQLVLTASSTSEHALDPIRALEAVSALKADPSSPAAIQRYQEDFMGSRISLLGDVLAGMLGLKDSGRTSSLLLAIRTQSALIQMRSALYASARSVSQARVVIDRVFIGASELQSQVEEVRARTDREVLVESGIDEALLRGSKEMKAVLESLTWLKMVWRVDEIDSLLILQRVVSPLPSILTSSTFSQLTKLASPSPSPAFHSPILDNHLRQLTHSPTYALTPNTLNRPIQARRSQLYTTHHHAVTPHAQNTVLGNALSIGTGSEAGTALGAGALVAVASIRWAGLKRDLKATLEQGIEKNVAVVPMAAYEGLRELAGKQQEEIDVVRSDLISMQADVEALETARPS
ncbi:hypothetical protein EV424DRAFT_1574478 [Suillus variegatus]|nr:hypothetical protein EV424DRAFT_1574478 [Suillus variegatus]